MFLSSIGLAKKFFLSFSVWWYGKTQTNFLANPVFEHERKIATELNCLSLPSALLLSPLSGKYLANLFFQEPRVVTGPLLRFPDLASLPVSVCLSDNSCSDLTFTVPSFSLVYFLNRIFPRFGMKILWYLFTLQKTKAQMTCGVTALPLQCSWATHASCLETSTVQRKPNLHAWLGSCLQIGWGLQNKFYGSIAQHFPQRNPKMSRLSLPLTVNWNVWGGQFGNVLSAFQMHIPLHSGILLGSFQAVNSLA